MSILKFTSNICLLAVCIAMVGCERGDPYVIYPAAFSQHRLFRLAESGDPQAQYLVGSIYEHGRGREPNKKLAIEWYKRAATNGNHSASYSLSRIYEPLPLNDVVAREPSFFWLTLAAKQGNPFAQAKLAKHYSSAYDPKKIYLSIAWGNRVAEDERNTSGPRIFQELSPPDRKFTCEDKERAFAVSNLLRQAVNNKLWKKELRQGMVETNYQEFEWTLEYLSKPGLIPPAPPVRPGNTSDRKRKTFLDELQADNIEYVLIGESAKKPEYFREHLYKKIRVSKFEKMLCVTNRQAITMLTDELCKSRKPRDSDFLGTPQSNQIYVSKSGDVVAYCFSYRISKSVSVCKGSVVRRNGQFYVKWDWEGGSDPKENVDYVACQSDKYAEMISELLKNKDK